MKRVLVFKLPNGREPFGDWHVELPIEIRAMIDTYIDRVAIGGSKKNIRSLKNGLFEIKIDRGPGYRIYFAEEENSIVLFLGGDKKSQDRDIRDANYYWRIYAQK